MLLTQTLIDRGKRFFRRDVLFNQVLVNSGWLVSAGIVTTALAFVQSLTVARALGAEQYGVLALIAVYAGAVSQFMDSRVSEAAIKFVVQYREKGDFARAAATVKLCYLVDAIAGGLAFVVVVVTAGWAARLLVKDGQAAGLIQFYALSVLIGTPIGTSSALLRLGGQFDRLAYQEVGASALRLVGVFAVAALGLGIRGLLSVYLVTAAIATFVLMYLSQRVALQLDLGPWWHAPFRLLSGEYRRILSFMVHTNLSGTSRIATSKADTLILGWLATPSDVGLYRLARTLSDPLAMLIGPVYSAVYPALSGLVAKGDFQHVRSLQRKLSSTIVVIIFPACVFLTLGVAWIIPVLFGRGFQGAVVLTRIMLWQVVWTPMIWLPGLLLSVERARMLAGLNWFDAVVYLALLLILVPHSGALGAAVATLLRFLVWTAMALLVAAHVNRHMH